MSPRSKEQFEEIRSQSREKILKSALNLFSQKGFENTSMSQIARESGVSKGLIYNYFSGKEDLLDTLIDQIVQLWIDTMHNIDPNADPETILRKIVFLSFDFLSKDIEETKKYMFLMMQPQVYKKIMQKLEPMLEHFFTDMARVLSSLGVNNPELEARYLAAVIDGLQLHYMHFQDEFPLEEMLNLLLSRYLK